MSVLSLDEIKKIELNILKDVAYFCDLNDIRYYLSGGTLLGAIRHKGFIPWDDDIDIIMPRPDYIRFIDNYHSHSNKNFVLTSINNNKDHLFTYAKVYDKRTEKIEKGISYNENNVGGVEIDIFPMDGVPEETKKSNNFFKKQKMWFKLYCYSILKYERSKSIMKTMIKYFVLTVCRFIGKKNFIKLINRRAMRYEFEESKFVAVSIVPYYGNKEKITKKIFVNQIKVQFEDDIFNISIGYHEYLTNLYGDYMKLPPEEKRVTHHNYIARKKENI